MASYRPKTTLAIHDFTMLPSTTLTVRSCSVSIEILHAHKKDIVISKNANVSEERRLFSEHNGGNPIF